MNATSSALAGPAEIQVFLHRHARWTWWCLAAVAAIALAVALIGGKGEPAALATAGVFVVVMLAFTWVARRKLNATWKGEVVRTEVREIRRRRQEDDVVRTIDHEFLLHVRTDSGAKHRVRVGQEALEHYYVVGGRIVKLAGLSAPVKLAPGHPGLCASCGVLLAHDIAMCPRCRCPVPDPARF